MADQPSVKDGLSRRLLLKSVPMVAVASAAAIPTRGFAQGTMTHEASKYQDQPKNGLQCSNCQLFAPPAACKIVASPISPTGWCQFFVAKST